MKNVIVLLVLLVLNACNFNFKIIKGNGEIIVKEIDLEDFSEVNIGGHFKVALYRSTRPGIIIETDENLIEHINIDIHNNLLSINSEYTLRPTDELLIEIYYEDLSGLKSSGASSIEHTDPLSGDDLKVDLSGAGSIDLNLDVDELDLNLSGAGLMELRGLANSQVVYLSGAGALEAKDLESDYCEIHISGIGNAKVNVRRELNAHISGMGNIEYFGDPEEIIQNVSGLGKVKRGEEQARDHENI